jgi:hypothetical protein
MSDNGFFFFVFEDSFLSYYWGRFLAQLHAVACFLDLVSKVACLNFDIFWFFSWEDELSGDSFGREALYTCSQNDRFFFFRPLDSRFRHLGGW